jgi:hypothetical protein
MGETGNDPNEVTLTIDLEDPSTGFVSPHYVKAVFDRNAALRAELAELRAKLADVGEPGDGTLVQRSEYVRCRKENARLREAVEAARLFRKADTGGGFNDRVECGRDLDAALAALAPAERKKGE